MTGEGVSSNLGRWIGIGQRRSDLKGMRDAGEVGGELHGGAMAGDRRCSSNSVHRPPLNEPKAREATGYDGELVRVP